MTVMINQNTNICRGTSECQPLFANERSDCSVNPLNITHLRHALLNIVLRRPQDPPASSCRVENALDPGTFGAV